MEWCQISLVVFFTFGYWTYITEVSHFVHLCSLSLPHSLALFLFWVWIYVHFPHHLAFLFPSGSGGRNLKKNPRLLFSHAIETPKIEAPAGKACQISKVTFLGIIPNPQNLSQKKKGIIPKKAIGTIFLDHFNVKLSASGFLHRQLCISWPLLWKPESLRQWIHGEKSGRRCPQHRLCPDFAPGKATVPNGTIRPSVP